MTARPLALIAALALLAPFTACSTVASGPVETPVVAGPAQTTPAQTTPAAPEPVRTLLTDVDGDAAFDTVALHNLGADRFRITVTTQAGPASSVDFTSELEDYWEPTAALYGTATLDKVKGSEVIVNLWHRTSLGGTGSDRDLAVYTWRSGALTAEKAPKAPKARTWHFGDFWGRAQGYRFFTSHGRRYVDVSDLRQKSTSTRWSGRIVRSVWKQGAWVRVSSRTVSLTPAKAAPYLQYSGPPVLLQQYAADIDGDGTADDVRFYRSLENDTSRFRVKVITAAGPVVTKAVRGEASDTTMVGAAELDGAAGREIVLLAFSEDPWWRVLTWRSGALVDEPAPAMCGREAGGDWMGCSDESITRFDFSTVDGVPTVVVGEVGVEDSYAWFQKAVWQAGAWVSDPAWGADLTPAEREAFTRGFFGVGFVSG